MAVADPGTHRQGVAQRDQQQRDQRRHAAPPGGYRERQQAAQHQQVGQRVDQFAANMAGSSPECVYAALNTVIQQMMNSAQPST